MPPSCSCPGVASHPGQSLHFRPPPHPCLLATPPSLQPNYVHDNVAGGSERFGYMLNGPACATASKFFRCVLALPPLILINTCHDWVLLLPCLLPRLTKCYLPPSAGVSVAQHSCGATLQRWLMILHEDYLPYCQSLLSHLLTCTLCSSAPCNPLHQES